MNKQDFIEQEINKNKLAFGRWHSTEKRNSADHFKLLTEPSPKNEEEVLQHGNALANTGNYPVGTSACFNVGISGGCGLECFVYLSGKCGKHDEMYPFATVEDEERHLKLYPKSVDREQQS